MTVGDVDHHTLAVDAFGVKVSAEGDELERVFILGGDHGRQHESHK
jgi:hypothetical protein